MPTSTIAPFTIGQSVRIVDTSVFTGYQGHIGIPPAQAGKSHEDCVWVEFERLPNQWVMRSRLAPVVIGRTT